jgi:hypothetical protein
MGRLRCREFGLSAMISKLDELYRSLLADSAPSPAAVALAAHAPPHLRRSPVGLEGSTGCLEDHWTK